MATGPNNVSVTGQQSNVTVNAGSPSLTCPAGIGRQVLVTPLRATPAGQARHKLGANYAIGVGVPKRVLVTLPPTQSSQAQQPKVPNSNVLPKVLLKAHSQNKKDPVKTFTLRNLDLSAIKSRDDLKAVIKERLTNDITADYYDVGYIQGSNVVRVRTSEDLDELWALLKQPRGNVAIWCDGLAGEIETPGVTTSRKRKKDNAPEAALPVNKKKVDTHERVQTLVNQLKDKHSTNFTPMQYRIWGELIVGGQHVSINNAPENNSMFDRAGGGSKSKSKDVQSPMAQALTEAATAITSVLSPNLAVRTHGTRNSPAKLKAQLHGSAFGDFPDNAHPKYSQ